MFQAERITSIISRGKKGCDAFWTQREFGRAGTNTARRDQIIEGPQSHAK